MATRRNFMAAGLGLAAVSLLNRAAAQVQPLVVYDEELKNGWQNWSWAKVEFSAPAGGTKPIKVQGDPWSALALHHDAFPANGYTKLTFVINGGPQGGQELAVKAMVDGKPAEASYFIQPKAKTWTRVEVPLKELVAAGKTIDGIALQGQANAYNAYYVTRIQFE